MMPKRHSLELFHVVPYLLSAVHGTRVAFMQPELSSVSAPTAFRFNARSPFHPSSPPPPAGLPTIATAPGEVVSKQPSCAMLLDFQKWHKRAYWHHMLMRCGLTRGDPGRRGGGGGRVGKRSSTIYHKFSHMSWM